MPVQPALTTTVAAGVPYYRITSRALLTNKPAQHRNVVNGAGAVASQHGSRYSNPNALAVYLTEDVETCLAERMFYFHREIVAAIDMHQVATPHALLPSFRPTFVLWEIVFKKAVPDVFDLTVVNAPAVGAYPFLMLNPSQDYRHLKQRRADVQANGYRGLRAPSSRVWGNGNMVVLFSDQSKNVQQITPYLVVFELLQPSQNNVSLPFVNHATELLSFDSGHTWQSANPCHGFFGNLLTHRIIRFHH